MERMSLESVAFPVLQSKCEWRFKYVLSLFYFICIDTISRFYYTSFLSSAHDGSTSWSTSYAVEGSNRNVVFRKFS